MDHEDPQHGLPVARVRPRDAADQLVRLRAQARHGARHVGRFAVVVTKTVAMIALCGAGVFLIGSSRSYTPRHYEFDGAHLDRLEMQRLDDSIRLLDRYRDLANPDQLTAPPADRLWLEQSHAPRTHVTPAAPAAR